MKHLNNALLLVLVGSTFCVSSVCAQKTQPTVVGIRNSGSPSFVTFNTNDKSNVKISEAQSVLSTLLNLKANDNLSLAKAETDEIGFTHQRYQQYYKGVKVEHGTYIIHADAKGSIESANGEFYKINELEITPKIDEATALQKALNSVNATAYKWEDAAEENHLKSETRNANATYYPKGELVIVDDYNQEGENLALAYKFEVYATNPLSRDYIYVDATSGKILLVDAIIKGCVTFSKDQFEKEAKETSFHTNSYSGPSTDAGATGDSKYSGNVRFTSDSFSGKFRLREAGRGNGIQTLNMKTGTSTAAAVDFTDNDNNWTSAEFNNAAFDIVAIDAHWGAEKVYDYWKADHNRNSYDGNGTLLKSYVHEKVAYDNAFWDGTTMHYGDGKQFKPLTALDVCGHEIGHGVCSATARLVYKAESGALNEGFSDIWGAMVENFAAANDPNKNMWWVGEELPLTYPKKALRFMDKPNDNKQPDTYKGTNWVATTSTSDNGGVHTNSGVINFWCYLSSVGGSGTNDISSAYTVEPIGIKKVAQIAFRAESKYLTANSPYTEARTATIKAATDLYGACSQEVKTVTDAWYAVGVGAKYTGTTLAIPTITNVSAVLTCNTTVAGATYQWYLNDVAITGATAATHTATQGGKYTVTIKDGNSCSATSAVFNYSSSGIANATATETTINVYPNPANGRVNLVVNGYQGNVTIELLDLSGRVLSVRQESVNNAATINYNISNVAAGCYLVKTTIGEKSIMKKLTIVE